MPDVAISAAEGASTSDPWTRLRPIPGVRAIRVTLAGTGQARMALLTAALVIGAVSSHMPGRFRYYSIVHQRMIGDTERG